MSINLEKIDLLKERANVSYTEAKEALERTNGDLVEALILLEKESKIKKSKKNFSEHIDEKGSNISEEIRKFFRTMRSYNFRVTKSGKIYLDVPLVLAMVLAILCMPTSMVIAFILFVTGFRFMMVKNDGTEKDMQDAIKEAVSKFEEKEEIKEENKEE